MPLIIENKGAGICFTNNGNQKLVLKHSIKTIGLIRSETIRIDVKEDHRNIIFRHRDVVSPFTNTARELARKLYDMMQPVCNCNCCGKICRTSCNEE